MVSSEPSSDLKDDSEPVIGVLALQGSFPLHLACLRRCGVRGRRVREPGDLEGIRGLIIPGGESTTMENLARRCGLIEALREAGQAGMPIFGTCAGAILMGKGDERPERLELVDVEVRRNAYGRQVDSFSANLFLTPFDRPFHGVFIRAPVITDPGAHRDGEVLGKHDGNPVLLRSGRMLLATFHPELTEDLRIHRLFLQICGIEKNDAPAKASGETADESGNGRLKEIVF